MNAVGIDVSKGKSMMMALLTALIFLLVSLTSHSLVNLT